MNELILTEPLAQELRAKGPEVGLTDAAGRPVGVFLSVPAYERLRYVQARALVSDEELEASRQSGGAYRLADLLADR